jgi:16S rRNA (cytosine967-C5)-methyltransferase
VASSRHLALETLIEWERGDSFAQDLIDSVASRSRLEHRDTALLQTLVYGVLRNINLLDEWLDILCSHKHLEDEVHWLMRLGLAQLLLLEMPPHAVVNETVELGGKARGLINAVLRRAEREKAELLAHAEQLPLTTRYSHPEWLVERWVKQFGVETAQQLCEWNQTVPASHIRANRLHQHPLTETELSAYPRRGETDFYLASQPPRDWLAMGRCYTQDPSTAVACELLAPQPGENVLDACAAPGGKTAYLSQLMRSQGLLIACDSSALRLRRMDGNLQRLQVRNAKLHQHDWTTGEPVPWSHVKFDRILLDVPCSNTGVMSRRVDVRWRLEPFIFSEMHSLQLRIAQGVIPLLKPGGTLVYSTCSLDPEENEQLVSALLQKHRHLSLVQTQASKPWLDGVDGAFAAVLKSS